MKKTPASSPIYTGELNGTPVGNLRIAASDFGLVAVAWADSHPGLDAYLSRLRRPIVPDARRLQPYAQELTEYLNGKRAAFTLPVDWTFLTPFQCEVLQAIYRIPYGETRTYLEVALEINRPRACRAVGRAAAMNPMPLVIPCHRVIGTDGKLHGYGGGQGLKTKEWLLRMEGALMT